MRGQRRISMNLLGARVQRFFSKIGVFRDFEDWLKAAMPNANFYGMGLVHRFDNHWGHKIDPKPANFKRQNFKIPFYNVLMQWKSFDQHKLSSSYILAKCLIVIISSFNLIRKGFKGLFCKMS